MSAPLYEPEGKREITTDMIERALDQEYGSNRWQGSRIEDLARQRMRAVLDAANDGNAPAPVHREEGER